MPQPATECTTCGAIVLGVAEPSEPVAWCVTMDGWVTANVHMTPASAEAQMRQLNRDYPGTTRTVLPLYAAPPALPDGAVEAMQEVEAMRMAEHALSWLLATVKGSDNVKIAQAALDALRAQIAQIGGGR